MLSLCDEPYWLAALSYNYLLNEYLAILCSNEVVNGDGLWCSLSGRKAFTIIETKIPNIL